MNLIEINFYYSGEVYALRYIENIVRYYHALITKFDT